MYKTFSMKYKYMQVTDTTLKTMQVNESMSKDFT